MSYSTTDFSEVLRTEATTVDLFTEGENPFRFKGIVDQHGEQLAAVSDRYSLVQNMDVARAVGDALHDNGVPRESLRRGSARYANGKSRFDLKLPSEQFNVPGDPSDIIPTIQVGNDYRGASTLWIRVGLFRVLCTNGMVAFVRGHALALRHVGDLGYDRIYMLVASIILQTLQEAQDQRDIAHLLASVPEPDAWVTSLLEETSKRYRSQLEGALQENSRTLGYNAWAVAQAISEVATHDMPSGWAAEQWATTAVQSLLQEVQTTQLTS